MLNIVFKNLEPSEMAKDIVTTTVESVLKKVPRALTQNASVILSMDHSPIHAGPDLFGVKLVLRGAHYKNLVIEKKAQNFYEAVHHMSEALLESLNRYISRDRMLNRRRSRRLKSAEKNRL